jgi:hypothetical protein
MTYKALKAHLYFKSLQSSFWNEDSTWRKGRDQLFWSDCRSTTWTVAAFAGYPSPGGAEGLVVLPGHNVTGLLAPNHNLSKVHNSCFDISIRFMYNIDNCSCCKVLGKKTKTDISKAIQNLLCTEPLLQVVITRGKENMPPPPPKRCKVKPYRNTAASVNLPMQAPSISVMLN